MIAPLIDYGDTMYSGTSDKNLSRLQKLQNRGLRICLKNQEYVSRIQLHQLCKVSPLKLRRKYNLRKFMFKQKQNKEITINRVIRTRRHDAILFETCRPNLELYKKSSIYRGVREWNNLPVDIRRIESFDIFKKNQKNEMYDQLPNIDGTFF